MVELQCWCGLHTALSQLGCNQHRRLSQNLGRCFSLADMSMAAFVHVWMSAGVLLYFDVTLSLFCLLVPLLDRWGLIGVGHILRGAVFFTGNNLWKAFSFLSPVVLPFFLVTCSDRETDFSVTPPPSVSPLLNLLIPKQLCRI